MTGKWSLIGASIVTLVLSASANAQTIGDPAPPGATPVPPEQQDGSSVASERDAPNTSSGDIVVTARRREERLRDVPISVTAITGTQLVETKITQVVDLAARIPNFTVSGGANLPFALVRGFGSGNNTSFDQAVGKFIDNVSYGRDQDVRLPLFDVERIEVLKGPQVLLYGNSATAGALNITSRKPGDQLAADASVAYDFEAREVVAQGGVTLPIADNLSLRVAGLYQYLDEGRTFNTLTGRDAPQIRNHAGRATLRFEPTSALTATLKAEYARLREAGDAGEAMSQVIFGIVRLPDVTLDSRTAINNNVAPFFQRSFLGVNTETYQGDLNYDFGDSKLSSTTAYRKLYVGQSTPAPTPVPILNAYLAYDYKQFSQELRYFGSFDRLDLLVGGYFQRDTFSSNQIIDLNLRPIIPAFAPAPPPFALNNTIDQLQKSYSLFADATYRFAEELSLELGGRYTWIAKDADQAQQSGNVVPNKTFGTGRAAISINPAFAGLFVSGTGVPPHVFTGLRLRDEYFQPQAVLQYKISPKVQAYAKFVRGEKAGGFDNGPGTPPVAEPADITFGSERATSYEAGIKGLILDNTLDFAVAVFRTDFKDLQASVFQTLSFAVTNVGAARTEGVEVELNLAPLRGLKIGASGAYLDSRYLDFPGQPCTVAQAVAFGGLAGCSQDLSGARTQFSSKWAGTLSIDYEQPVGDLVLGGGAAFFARSRYNASPNNEPLQEQDGYAQIDAQFSVKDADGRWSVAFFGRNLTDKQLLEFGTNAPGPGLGGALSGFRSRGRQLGLRFGINY